MTPVTSCSDILFGISLITCTAPSSPPVLVSGILPIAPSISRAWVLPDERIAGWGLPGHGDAHSDCGTFFTLVCLEDHSNGLDFAKRVPNLCYRPSCPVCFKAWIARATARVVYRFGQYSTRRSPIHVTASVPRSLWGLSPSRLRLIAYRVVKKTGLYGGCCIFHPFRQDEYNLSWYYSPHFHYIGFGWISNAGDEYRSSGWIVKNIGVRDSIEATVYYQLTHCGVWYGEGRKHSVTWFGSMSYGELSIVPMPKKGTTCPEGHELHRGVAVGEELLPDEICERWVPRGSYVYWLDNLFEDVFDRLGMAPTTSLSVVHASTRGRDPLLVHLKVK